MDSYARNLRLHIFFRNLPTKCISRFCASLSKRVFARGDVVRPERRFLIAREAHLQHTEMYGLKFVFRGTVRSGWEIDVFLRPPDSFDDDTFFSLPGACTIAAPELYAVGYTEILLVEREKSLHIIAHYPECIKAYASLLARMRWRATATGLRRTQLLTGLEKAITRDPRLGTNTSG